MLWRLAWRNVLKSYRDYFIYFLTLSFSICLFYTFNSFESQAAVMKITEAQSELLEVTNSTMFFLSIFVAIILGFLVLYASHYLIRRRKKELATYMILGMSSRDTALILTLETLFIGFLSLATGLLMGVFVSQLMGLITAQMFLAEVSQYHIFFSFNAFVITVFAFCLIFFVVICFYQIILRRYSLRTLLEATSRSEKLIIRSIPTSILLFILSLILLAYAYHILLDKGFIDVALDPVMLVCGVLGTFLFFFSLSGFFLKLFQSNKCVYFRNLNVFVLRQLHSSINSSFVSISIICLMLLLGIGAIASGFSITQTVNQSMEVYSPVDITLHLETSKDFPLTLSEFFEKHELDYDIFTNVEALHMSAFDDYTLDGLWKDMDKELINTKLKNVGAGIVWFIPLSDYQKFQGLTKQKPLHLETNEVYIGASDGSITDALSSVSKNTKQLMIHGQPFTIKNKEAKFFLPYNNENSVDETFFVVPDDWYHAQQFQMTFNKYNALLKKDADLSVIQAFFEKDVYTARSDMEPSEYYYFNFATKDSVYQSKSQTTVVYSYVGIYLGFVFLLSSTVLLALHQLTAAEDNKQRYAVLRKIGVSEKMINHSIFIQIAIYFLLPLSLALIHSFIGLKGVSEVVILLGKGNIFIPALLTTSIVAIIYIAYFYAVYRSYRYILKKEC